MNKLEDFTEGSEWLTPIEIRIKFHSFDPVDGLPLFTCDVEHPYSKFDENDGRPVGTIGFLERWVHFIKIENQ